MVIDLEEEVVQDLTIQEEEEAVPGSIEETVLEMMQSSKRMKNHGIMTKEEIRTRMLEIEVGANQGKEKIGQEEVVLMRKIEADQIIRAKTTILLLEMR